MRTEWVDEWFCVRCLRTTEHVRLTFNNDVTMTCQFCQETTSVVEEVEEEVKKSFTVVSVDLQYNNPKRRMVQAEIKIDYTKDQLAETVKESEYVKIEWPAYENMHYTAQVMPSNGGSFNYKDAREISKVLKQFIGEE